MQWALLTGSFCARRPICRGAGLAMGQGFPTMRVAGSASAHWGVCSLPEQVYYICNCDLAIRKQSKPVDYVGVVTRECLNVIKGGGSLR